MTEPETPADLTESQRWIIELNELDSDASDTHPCQGGNCEGVGLITTDDIAEGRLDCDYCDLINGFK